MATSNFIDSGWTPNLSGASTFSQNVADYIITGVPQTPIDLYNTTPQCGVFMINGTSTLVSPGEIYPVLCSCKNVNLLGLPVALDDAYLVYPGFGFRLYYDPSYAGTSSNYYFNTSNKPCLFQLDAGTWSGATNIYVYGSTSTRYGNNNNETESIKVYYRNKEITIGGISS